MVINDLKVCYELDHRLGEGLICEGELETAFLRSHSHASATDLKSYDIVINIISNTFPGTNYRIILSAKSDCC